MSLSWDQIQNLQTRFDLTDAKKNKLEEAEALGRALRNSHPDTSAVTPAQAKQIRNFVNDMRQRLEPAMLCAEYILRKMREDAAKSADNAVPNGTL